MHISRRRFLEYCGISSAVLGLDPLRMGLLQEALANPAGPAVVWLHGSSCTGCSVSLLNRISDNAPHNVAEVLTDNINLIFHPTLMALAGDPAVAALRQVYETGNYVLVLEGGVPTAFNGACCVVYSYRGEEVTFEQAVQEYSARAAAIVCVGTCASFGGIPASGTNPTGVVSVPKLTGRPTINISGCPANPDWVCWAIVQLILGNPVPLDEFGRPVALYQAQDTIHHSCPRNTVIPGNTEAASFADCDGKCLINLGCRGPFTTAKCQNCWNGKEDQGHWCIGVNSPCQGCVEPSFPGPNSFFEPYSPS